MRPISTASILSATSCLALFAAAACGARTNLYDGTTTDASPGDAGPTDAAVQPHDALPEAGDAAPDVTVLAGPCHLVQAGEPIVSVRYSNPEYRFFQSGLMSVPGSNGSQQDNVIQYGLVEGMRTGVWADPPIFAAQYDAAQWPPEQRHAPTQLFDSAHSANLLSLPNDKLAVIYTYDRDGGTQLGVRFRTASKTNWKLDPDVPLVDLAIVAAPPVIAPDSKRIALAYEHADAHTLHLGFYDFQGKPAGATLLLPSNDYTDPSIPRWENRPSVAATRTHVLAANIIRDCGDTGKECVSGEIALWRVDQTGDTPLLTPVFQIPTPAGGVPTRAQLFSDGAGHNWLGWLRQESTQDRDAPSEFIAFPLSDDGQQAGPAESWFKASLNFRQPSVGPLGVVTPMAHTTEDDSGFHAEVHLVHRQLDTPDYDDISVATITTWPSTFSSAVAVAQLPESRSLIVGYTRFDENKQVQPELMRFTCLED